MSCDVYWSNVGLLLTMDGSDGSNSFVDSSNNAVSITANDATLSAATPMFGSACGNFTSRTASYLSVPNSAGGPNDLVSGDWTIELWFRIQNTVNGQIILFSQSNEPYTFAQGFRLSMDASSGGSGNTFFQAQAWLFGGADFSGSASVSANLYDGNWHAFAFSFSASTNKSYCFVDGVLAGSATISLALSGYSGSLGTAGLPTYIASDYSLSPLQSTALVGQLDELRITKGVARYTANYTPASVAFPTVACTNIVPNVVGLSQTAATAALAVDGFSVGTVSQSPSTQPPGTVLSQNPAAGSVVTPGSSVNLTVSEGAIVPSVFNLSVPAATTVLAASGFVLGAISYQYDVLVIPGNVDAQNPAAGSYAAAGSAIAVTLSAGRGPVVVPDILGDTVSAANAAILGIGLVVGAVTSQASLTVPAGEVISQNPYWGTPVGSGTIVSYVISTGPPAPLLQFDVMVTLISQFANSPTLVQLVKNMAAYVDQSQNFANFYNFVWNVNTAQGFGLDIWGKIVNVSRLLQIPITARYVGFQDGTGPGTGTDVEPFSEKGSWYVPAAATQSYLLEDGPYRQLILTKALANIVNTTVPAFNQLLQNLFPGRGNPYVVTSGTMAMTFHFDFALTPIELAILQQSGAVPIPPGVSFTIVTP